MTAAALRGVISVRIYKIEEAKLTLEERVIKTIEDNLEKKATVTPTADLRNDLGLDSFAMVIIINALEDEFGITIEEGNFNGINNVVDIVNGLRQYYPEIIKESNEQK